MDKPTISPVIPRIGEQIRLSLILAKSSGNLQVPSTSTTALNPRLPTPAISNWNQSEMPALSIALQSQFGSFVQHMLVNNLVEVVRIAKTAFAWIKSVEGSPCEVVKNN